MNRVAHDGMRVRAHAGAASFRSRQSLEQLLQDAQAQVEALRREVADDPGAGTRRVRAARQRAATEREQRIELALKAMEEFDKALSSKGGGEGKGTKRPVQSTQANAAQDRSAPTAPAPDERPATSQAADEQPSEASQVDLPKQPRASTTDCDARVMKMADGGFRPLSTCSSMTAPTW